jgi:hypothetical protein
MAKRTRTALREEARRKGARLDECRSVRCHRGGRRPGLVKKLRRKRVGFVEGSGVSPRHPKLRAQSRCSTGTKLPIERRKTRNLLMSGQQVGGETSATALVQPDNCCASNVARRLAQVERAWAGWKIPNSRSQIPGKLQKQVLKFQRACCRVCDRRLVAGTWNLFGIWLLELGVSPVTPSARSSS